MLCCCCQTGKTATLVPPHCPHLISLWNQISTSAPNKHRKGDRPIFISELIFKGLHPFLWAPAHFILVLYLWQSQMCHFPPRVRSLISTRWYDNSRGFHPCQFPWDVEQQELWSVSKSNRHTSHYSFRGYYRGRDANGMPANNHTATFCLPCWPKPIMLKPKLLSWNKITFTFMVDYLFILRPPGGAGGSSCGEEALGCWNVASTIPSQTTGWRWRKLKGEEMAPKCFFFFIFFTFRKWSGKKKRK